MKIILCIFLLNITAVSVFGQSVELNGTLEKSIEFPAAVKKGGFLMYSGVTLGDVTSGIFRTPRNKRFNGRVQWDSSTGFFSLSGLKMEDIGEYEVQNTDQNINTVFQLNVHAVNVFDQSVELNRILGESVKFPAAVKKGGYLMYGGDPIGDSSLGTPGIGNYRGRLDWDSCTGLFSLSGLKMEDIGEYKVHNTDQNINVFQLNVYKDNVPVSKPHVSVTQNEYPCTIECTAERGTGVTLSWYREGEKKSFASSRVASAPHLHLPHSVESGTYTCEAKNSVSNEKASITVGDHCTAPTSSSTIAAIIIAAVVVLIAVVFAVLLHPVRTLIQVKKLLDNVDLHAYDETVPPDAVRPFILVKNLLDNVDLHAYAVRTLIQVKKILHNVDPFECDETDPPNAVRTFILVKQLLDIVDPHVCGFIRRCLGFNRKRRDYIISNSPSSDRMRFPSGHLDETDPPNGKTRLPLTPDDRRTLIQVKKLLNNVDLHASGETSLELSPDGETSLELSPDGETWLELSPDAVRTLIDVTKRLNDLDLHPSGFKRKRRVTKLLNDLDLHPSDGFRGCLGPEATKTSSHQEP